MIIYLYVKTHCKTGLKYLGKTSQPDPHAYPGSGTRWVRHLKKHGYNYTTKIIQECKTNDEVSKWGGYYSDLWNVVNSNDWANLKREEGDGGKLSSITKDKIRKSLIGRQQTREHIEKNSKAHLGNNNIMYGKTHTAEARVKISQNRKNRPSPTTGKVYSAEERNKISASVKALPKLKCVHCGVLSAPGNYKRWHGNNCRSIFVNPQLSS